MLAARAAQVWSELLMIGWRGSRLCLTSLVHLTPGSRVTSGGILESEVVTTLSSFRSSELSSPSEAFLLLAPAKGAQLCLLKLSWTKLINFVMSAHVLKGWQNTIRPCRRNSSRSRAMFAAPPRYWLWWLPQSCTASMGTIFQLSVSGISFEVPGAGGRVFLLQPVTDKRHP
jgi:hypothetical protein